MTSVREKEWMWLRLVPASGSALALVLLILGFGFASPNFLSMPNAWNVTTQATLLLVLALPMTLVIMTEGLDLSIGAVLSLGTVVLAVAIKSGLPVVPSLITCLLVGIAVGAANGALIGMLGTPPFVATLGTMGIAGGLALVISDGRDLVGLGSSITSWWGGWFIGIPVPLFIAGGIFAAMHVMLNHSRFGVAVVALGGNREALRLAGRSVPLNLVMVYALAGGCASIAAILLAARIDGGNATAANGMEFDAIAAVVIGGTSFIKGRGTLIGTLIGALLITVLRNGMNLMALSSSVQVAAIGILAITALALEARGQK